MGIKWAANARMTASAAAAAAVLAVGLAACGQIGGGTTSPTATVTATAPASQASAANSSATPASHAADAAGASADTTGRLPDYQPASVVSKTSTSTVLTSPDSVAKIGAFYADVLAKGGWHVISSSVGSFHASFTVSHDHQGASVSVYPRWGGSGISISTYPR